VGFEGIGAAVKRKEDFRFLTGRGRFVADISFPGELHCAIARSTHAHACIRRIDKSAAEAMPGVVAVLTGQDMAVDRVGPLRCLWRVLGKNGEPAIEPPRYALAREVVRHVGEPVVAVVAETLQAATDAAERVEIEYEPLRAVTSAKEACGDDSPWIHATAPGNISFVSARGDAAKVDAAFAAARQVVSLELVNQRIAGAAIEPRAAIALSEPGSDTIILYDSTQSPHHMRRLVAEDLGMPEGAIRVISPDVGGGFGYKGKHYPEETIVAWLARRLKRPVKWVATRGESFLSDTQARDHATFAELAFDDDGHFLALRVRTIANLGAYISTMGAAIPGAIYMGLLAGMYRTPAIYGEVTAVFTNTVPVDAYRGAGRPEACYLLERLADLAARKLGLDRAEIRRRNLISKAAMPYRTPIGPAYDCGNFPRILERTLQLADYPGFEARRSAAARSGRLRGIGFACYVDSSGVAPSRLAGMFGARAGFYESAEIRVDADGGIQVYVGTHSHGQAHATTYAQIASSRLGVALDRIEVFEGDTGMVPIGTGTFGSRSIAVGGSAIDRAAAKVVAKGKRIAAHLLEAAESDIVFQDGAFAVSGTDRRVAFGDVARAAYVPHNYPLEELEPGLQESAFYDPKNFAYANGVHVCEVEIDPETGALDLVGYWVVDDMGTVINPMVCEGQVHGGLAQGLGQGLLESCEYDAASGQLLSGSFMDYAMPRADDLPNFVTEADESEPCTHNPLGAKGCGESGTIGAPAALVGAVLDALGPRGVTDFAMPATPERVWRAIAAAGSDPC
jgi:carbon-monoxide dehydrogenase large subunit